MLKIFQEVKMDFKKFLIILFFINFIFANFLVKEFYFSEDGMKIEKVDNYDLINLAGCDSKLEEVGKPIIPFKNINILIPADAEISFIEILELEKKELPGSYYLYPTQMPRPISEDEKEYPLIIDEKFYETEEEYPKEIYKIIPSGNKSGFRIGGVFLFPLHYIPKEKKLILYTKIKIRINYEEGKHKVINLTKRQREAFSQDIKYLVINPEDINRFSPPLRASDNPGIDYIILTDTNLVSSFIPLRDWLRKTGLWTEIRTTQWVNSNYQGRDLPEKIRNFIKHYFQTQSLICVLLGGDGDYNNPVVPTRQAVLPYGTRSWYIASDLYYADLDWSWDGNNNNRFGEWTGDTVDLYHDIYIGRLPVENTSQVDNFINKLFRYLKTPDTTYQKRLLLPGALLSSGYNHMQSQDTIANFSPSDWTDRLLDQGTNTGRRYEIRDSINQKFHFVHLVAHGNYEGSWITSETPQYHRNDCGQQTNTNTLCIINAISCMPGAFDSAVLPSCLAESILNSSNTGVGAIMNTRYGWYNPSSRVVDYSELFSIRFYDHFFDVSAPLYMRFSYCHQSSKERYRNQALSLNSTWRWCYYELTLFGEPSMLMWKDYPKKIVAYFPRQIYLGNQTFACTVKTITGLPIEGARVNLWKGSEIYQNGFTNANGVVSFNINPTTTGYMYVTVIRPNYLPYEDSTRINTSSQPPGTRIWGPRQLTNVPNSAGLYGICYVPNLNRVYITHFQARNIYIYSSDSLLTPLGTIPTPNNESAIVDIKYCAYDNTFWVHSNQTKRIYKISPTGTVLRYFNSPAQDYPTGLAWDEENRILYVADRRALNTLPQYIYVCDTLGSVIRQMNHPLRGNAGPRCLTLDLSNTNPNRPTLLNIYTSFNSGGTAIDSCGVYELNPANLTILQRFLIPELYNVRGIEFDPRDYSYWVTLMELEAGGPYNYVIKYRGFYEFVPIEEEVIGIEKIRLNTILFNEKFIKENKGILYNQFGSTIKSDNLNKTPKGIYFLKINKKWYKVIKF